MRRILILCVVFALPGIASAQDLSNMRPPPITGIAHITLYRTTWRNRSSSIGLLGWKMMPKGQARSGVRFYANHLQYIELISPPGPGRMNRLDSIAFATNDAESLRRYLDSRQVAVPRALTVDRDGSKTLLFMTRKETASNLFRKSSPAPARRHREDSAHISFMQICCAQPCRNGSLL